MGSTSVGRWAGLLVVVVILAACGAVGPTPSVAPTAEITAGPTPVPTSVTSGAPVPADVGAFTPPLPMCPGPRDPIERPTLVASLADVRVDVTMGPSAVETCSTAMSDDRPLLDPTTPLLAAGEGTIRFDLPEGWRFLYWGGSDHSTLGDGINILTGGETFERPSFVDVPAPFRPGPSVLILEAWVITEDERAIASISGAVLVHQP